MKCSRKGIRKVCIKAIKAAVKVLTRVTVALAMVAPLGMLLVKSAYKSRGYFAVGGEWMGIVGIVCLILWLMNRKVVSHES